MTTLVIDASVWVSAADPTDAFHAASRAFLREIVANGHRVVVPAFARVEIACALARRLRDARKARALTAALFEAPLLTERGLGADFLQRSLAAGTDALLRGVDALYLTTSAVSGGVLITWDDELIVRARGQRPTDWSGESP